MREEFRTLNGEEAEDLDDSDDDGQKTFKAMLASKCLPPLSSKIVKMKYLIKHQTVQIIYVVKLEVVEFVSLLLYDFHCAMCMPT